MESELKNQNDLLQQLKSLRAEKELLEKHVFVLNECLSVEELKTKISNLEKKKEMLGSLENVIERLRAEVEPLKYLKSVLKTKLGDENKMQSKNIGSELCIDLEEHAKIEPLKYLKTKPDVENKIQSNNIWSELSIDLEPNVPEYEKKNCNNTSIDVQVEQPVRSKTFISQSVEDIPTNSVKTDLSSYSKLNNEFVGTFQTPMPSKCNSVSTVNDGSLDECMQLLDQYDIVTDQEILNYPTEENNLKSQSVVDQKLIDNDNKIQNTQKATTSSYFDAESINAHVKDQVPIEKDIKLNLKNAIDLGCGTYKDWNSKLHEASTSQPTPNKESLCSDANVNIGDLLLKIPQLLLQQGIDYIQVSPYSVFYINCTFNQNLK
uniref:Uncharacterized protein n=1 Tax=Schizaphis graminum TaxID=13262 RepID=A0A2S2N9L2_SCHGA